jgi:crotonobetainyl-CoA:carnitine CoA-transferase CaiB-like acyl-CoA transferase
MGGTATNMIPELAYLDDVEELAEAFAQRPVAHWARLFNGSSAAIVPLGSLHDTRDASLQLESKGNIDLSQATFRSIRHDQHPMGRWVDLVASNAVRPTHSSISIPDPAPKYGAHTRSVLARLGYSNDAIDELIAKRAASEQWSVKYLPE